MEDYPEKCISFESFKTSKTSHFYATPINKQQKQNTHIFTSGGHKYKNNYLEKLRSLFNQTGRRNPS